MLNMPVKIHYASVAVLALAEAYRSGSKLTSKTISAKHDIPSQFLVQILQQLRTAGLIRSNRGTNGGFQLATSPEKIALADVIRAVAAMELAEACKSSDGDSKSSCGNVIQQVWMEIEGCQRSILEATTLDKLLPKLEESAVEMFYI